MKAEENHTRDNPFTTRSRPPLRALFALISLTARLSRRPWRKEPPYTKRCGQMRSSGLDLMNERCPLSVTHKWTADSKSLFL